MKCHLVTFLALVLATGCGDEAVQAIDIDLAVAPLAVDFGVIFVGETAQRSVSLYNRSRAVAELELLTDDGFSVLPARLRLAPGERRTVEVMFHPIEKGSWLATLRISGASDLSLALQGVAAEHEVIAPPKLDFGDTRIETRRSRALELTNLSAAAQLVEPLIEGEDGSRFDGPPPFMLQPGETRLVPLGFEPVVDRRHAARMRLILCETCDGPVVELIGNGTTEGIALFPASLDFGTVAVGASLSAEVLLSNQSRSPAIVVTATLVAPARAPISADLPAKDSPLEPRGSIAIPVSFAPRAAGEFAALLRIQVGSQVAELPIVGRSEMLGIAADPSLLAFGSMAPNARVERSLLLATVGGDVMLTGLSIEGDGFSFGSPPTLPRTLDRAPLELQIIFQSAVFGRHTAELVVTSSVPGVERRVPLVASVVSEAPCAIEASPAAVRFGMTPVGSRASGLVEVRNVGSADCELWAFSLAGTDAFSLLLPPDELVTLAPGRSMSLEVEYNPTSSALAVDHGTLVVESSPPGSPPTIVPISGLALHHPPEAVPPVLDFGERPVESRSLLSTSVFNSRSMPMEIVRAEVTDAPSFAVRMPSSLPRTLGAGSSETFTIEFVPSAVETVQGNLAVWFRDIPEPLIIRLLGTGSDDTCQSECLAPQVSCPSARTVFVHTTTRLTGYATAPAGLAEPVACNWAVNSAPESGNSVPWNLGDCAAEFRPDQVGDWLLTLTARDTVGRLATCDVVVHVESQPALLVELTWDAPDDVDLHLFHPNAGAATEPPAWFSMPWDCFFANGAPNWDGPERGDDPILDRDDRTGRGPEIIRIAQPIIDQPYGIGALWFDATHGNVGVTATIRVFCGGELAAVITTYLEAMHRAAVVGEVRFTDAHSCTFVPDGTKLWLTP